MTPYKETDIKNKFWTPEEWEKNLPSPGFVTDFVLATRGFNTPTKFCAWTALFLISSVLKRHTELDWGMLKFYANLFVFFVAPPALCAKSTVVNWATDQLLRDFHTYIEDPVVQEMKKLHNLIVGSATPEGLFRLLSMRKKCRVKNVFGESIPINHGSNVTIVISELSTFLGKSQYKQGLVQQLINLYDCKENDDCVTANDRKKILKNVYVTLLGATTPDGFDSSLPDQITGQGFLSRIVINMMDGPTRAYSYPHIVEGGPTVEDLQKRLAWVAESAIGTYTLSERAGKIYDSWYRRYSNQYTKGYGTPGRERDNIHVLKVALLLRAQRYEDGKTITSKDIKKAIHLIDDVRRDAIETTRGIGLDEHKKKIEIVRRMVRKRKEVTRRELLRSLSSRRIAASDITYALNQLKESGDVEITRGGRTVQGPSSDGDEVYLWKGE